LLDGEFALKLKEFYSDFKNTLHFSSIFMPDSHLSQGTWLKGSICGRFNDVSINISCKTYKTTKSPIVLQNHLANAQKIRCLSATA